MIAACVVIYAVYLNDRIKDFSKSNLELRRRLDIAEIRDDDLNRKLDRIIDNIDSIASKVYESANKITSLETKKPLD